MICLASGGTLLCVTSGWARVIKSHSELFKQAEFHIWLKRDGVGWILVERLKEKRTS